MIYPISVINSTNTGALNGGKAAIFIASMFLLNCGMGTGPALSQTSPATFENYRLDEAINTSSGSYYLQSHESSSESLFEFRRISGLTWDKIAEIFGVTRRAVHFWANGSPMEDFRDEKLRRLLSITKNLNTGLAVQNRRILFAEDEAGVSIFDLLKKGDFSAINLRIPSVAMHITYDFKPLSQKGRAELTPTISPFDLLNADNSRVDAGKTKVSAVSVRKVKRKS